MVSQAIRFIYVLFRSVFDANAFCYLLIGNVKEKEQLAEGVKMQNLENKLFPVLQKYVNGGKSLI